MSSNILPLCAFSFGAGCLVHLAYFRYGDWNRYTTRVVWSFVAIHSAIAAVHSKINEQDYFTREGYTFSSWIVGSAIAGIYTSMLVYRAFFHRLGHFPGPFAARLTNFYITSKSVKKFHLYEEVQALHNQYGDYVRVGPSELSIIDPKAVSVVHSNTSKCIKGVWYDALHPVHALHMIRDHKEHLRRRKVWDRGFSAKALRDYEPRVIKYTDQLLEKIESSKNRPLDVAQWFNFYSFDVMGDLAFGKPFDMLRSGVKHYFMTALHADMLGIGLLTHVIWFVPIFLQTPILNIQHKKFWAWIRAQVHNRMKNKPDRPDIASWIIDDYNAQGWPNMPIKDNLYADAHLIVIAGSDTTAATLTAIFYNLSLRPDTMRTLQAEIDELFHSASEPDSVALGKLEYLQAVIDEALRLHPPVPSGLQRLTPPEGITIGDTFVPGDTLLYLPSYTMYRDPRSFVRPNEFVPERWTTQQELVKDNSVLLPFSTGRYSCVGKHLGLMEVRQVCAEILRRYDVTFAPGQDPKGYTEGLRDTFTTALPKLELVFTERRKS